MEAANVERLREVLVPFTAARRAGRPPSSPSAAARARGDPGRADPRGAAGEARAEAARQLLEAYYRQVLNDGFFHADPHPGTSLGGRPDLLPRPRHGRRGRRRARELISPAAARVLAGGRGLPGRGAAHARRRSARRGRHGRAHGRPAGVPRPVRHGSLRELQLGPMLQGITEIAARRGSGYRPRWP